MTFFPKKNNMTSTTQYSLLPLTTAPSSSKPPHPIPLPPFWIFLIFSPSFSPFEAQHKSKNRRLNHLEWALSLNKSIFWNLEDKEGDNLPIEEENAHNIPYKSPLLPSSLRCIESFLQPLFSQIHGVDEVPFDSLPPLLPSPALISLSPLLFVFVRSSMVKKMKMIEK